MATQSSILAWEIWWATVHEVTKSGTRLSDWAHMHVGLRTNLGSHADSMLTK